MSLPSFFSSLRRRIHEYGQVMLRHRPWRALRWFSLRRWWFRLQFAGAALFVGFLCIAFAIAAEWAIHAHASVMQRWPWLSLLLAPAGFAGLAWVSMRFFPGTEGSGIPQTIAALNTPDHGIRAKLLSLKIAISKVFLTLGGLLCGASIGREGPSVQIGASIMRLLPNRRKKRSPIREADLMIAGGGAGVAAAFNTPLGGIMFAIEELCRHRTFHANGPILLAVIFAGLMSIAVLGQYVYFGRTPATVSWPDGVWPVLACGVAGGLLGGLFSRGLIASSQGLPGRVGVWAGQRPIALAAVCGLGTGLIGIMTNGLTYGTGYGESQAALGGHVSLPVYFMFAKLLVIWLAFLSRIPGGIFAPALAVGAGLGSNIALLIPGEHGSALMVLGMVGFLAGMTQAPITAFVIVMEMTANHQMFLPLMATAVVAHTLSCSVAPTPLYQALAGPALAKARLRAEKLPPATHAPTPSALS